MIVKLKHLSNHSIPSNTRKEMTSLIDSLQPISAPPIPTIPTIPTPPTLELTPAQALVFQTYKDGKNVFVTGPGGTGKSHLIRQIYADAKNRGKRIKVCAMTGCAALLLECDAKTVHSWAGIGLGNGDPGSITTTVCHNKRKKQNWTGTDILVIDEVSMMSARMFDLLDQVGRFARKNQTRPFGGIQLIFSGDFFQLPPIASSGVENSGAFCFESLAWDSTFHRTVELTRLFRQSDELYGTILNEIREGRMSSRSFKTLKSRVGLPWNETTDPSITVPILYPTRRKVSMYNKERFDCLDAAVVPFEYSHVPLDQMTLTTAQRDSYHMHRAVDIDMESKRLIDNSMCESALNLREGAQVMCVSNIDMDTHQAISNGSQGVVVGFTGPLPLVRFRSGITRTVPRFQIKSETMAGVAVQQIPLIHAWAISIHKSQGTTLEMARVDIGSNIFECGQTYVALSRIKSLDGLFLDEFDPSKIKIHKKVQGYYTRVRAKREHRDETSSVAMG